MRPRVYLQIFVFLEKAKKIKIKTLRASIKNCGQTFTPSLALLLLA